MNLSNQEFERQMEILDEGLGKEGIPAFFRPILAAVRFPCDNKLIGSFPRDPEQGPFEGPNLMYSIDVWYKRHYPAQSVVSEELCSRVILVRGEPFTIKIPTKFNVSRPLAVLEYVQNLSPSLYGLLNEREKALLQSKFDAFRLQTSNILLCQVKARGDNVRELCTNLLAAGWANLRACGDGFNRQDPAAALFDAQQAAEKYLKAFLAHKDGTLDGKALQLYGHNIMKLVNACAAYDGEFQHLVPHTSNLTYDQSVRYARPQVSIEKVLEIIDISHMFCDFVACSWIRRTVQD